jgi:SAM-dependent methyltransferase
VLDAGAGEQLYAPLFAEHVYESADFLQVEKPYAPKTMYVCDLREIPVESNRYDAVLLTQVLEHLPAPEDVLQELFRVLKPGGVIWATTPLFFEEHEAPFDFHRYTQYGLRSRLEGAGFAVAKVERLEGWFGVLGYQAQTMAKYLPRTPGPYGGGPTGLLLAAIAWPASVAALAMSRLLNRLEMVKLVDAGYPKNYAAMALKPQQKSFDE